MTNDVFYCVQSPKAKNREYGRRIIAYLALMSEISRNGIQTQILKRRLPKGVMHRPRSLSNDPSSVPSLLSKTYTKNVDVNKPKDNIKTNNIFEPQDATRFDHPK